MTELIIGIEVFAALIIFYWGCKRGDTPQNTIKEQTPGDIFRALGAVLKATYESEDGSYHTYTVEYQGGYFIFVFRRNSFWVNIQFFDFKECAYEHLHKAYAAANELHIKQSAWNCTIEMGIPREDGTLTITTHLNHLFSSVGDLEQIKKELQILLSHAFVLAREFSEELDDINLSLLN